MEIRLAAICLLVLFVFNLLMVRVFLNLRRLMIKGQVFTALVWALLALMVFLVALASLLAFLFLGFAAMILYPTLINTVVILDLGALISCLTTSVLLGKAKSQYLT
ncbi:MAG: hypothetical protein UX13_C0041G0006 [Candidatus Woesebacteria bacterium GW2011_GWB1_45_5]|uniref:Uncharacterized protein n=1 Tax=Candidatus Woesebacteria bacterium GW2011_GWB1_45_5 TaxID=1618581 RepID=A0A0G1QL50_9BACT|nr:MAG: hypothetical protein UX13_C0041G0006 [Candidatus Woesebacteria bacterium GW2011_GWB1_45_5]